MGTKNIILIIIGLIIFVFISTILKISLAIGVVAYFFLREQFLKKYSKEFTEKIKWLLIIPIIQACLSIFSYIISNECIDIASKIDNLHNVSTYTPYLGELGNLVDFANQHGAFPEIEKSALVINFINNAKITEQIAKIGAVVTMILILLEIYGTYSLGKLTIRQMKVCNIAIALIFLSISILYGRFIDLCLGLFSNILFEADNIPYMITIPAIILLILCISYYYYSKSLNTLFSTGKERETAITSEPTKLNTPILQTEDQHHNHNQNHSQPIKHSIIPYILIGIGFILFITIMLISPNNGNNDETTEPTAETNSHDASGQPSTILNEESVINDVDTIEDETDIVMDSLYSDFYYNVYENDVYDFRIKIPSFFSHINESDSGDNCYFSKDSKTFLFVYGSYADNETIEDEYKEYDPETLAYSKLKDNWFVVSGYTDDDCIFYQKTVLINNTFFTAYLHYPISEKDFYSNIINDIFRTFPN